MTRPPQAGVRTLASRAALILGLSLLPGAVARAPALDPGKAITQYVRDVWQTEQGLPQNTVMSVTQTADGYLWLGTREGLVRFDGVRFKVFDRQTAPDLGHNFIRCLLADRKGRLWIGSSGGLVRREGGRFTRYEEKDGLPNPQVSALLEDRQGRLWVGTEGGGLARMEGDRFVREPSRGALGSEIRALLETDDGLWVATEAGLARLRNGELRSYTTAEGLSRRSVRSLGPCRAGGIWIGTDDGLNRLEGDRFTVFNKAQGLSSNVIVSLVEDREGTLWIGTDGGGLNRLREGKVMPFFTGREGLPSDSVYSLYEDREGSLWIGTNVGGLNRLRDVRFTAFSKPEGLSAEVARAVLEDRSGDLWIGTEGGGLNRLRDGKVTAFTTRQGLSNDTVFAIEEDRKGSLWIGTDSGLNRLKEDGRFEIFTANMGLSNDVVLALHEDREGSLWIGTYAEGLNRLKNGRFTAFTTKEGLAHNTVNVILEDHEGALWIGTRGGGLNRLKDGRFTAFTTKDGLADDLVFALHEDREGSLWIGTYGGGLSRMKNGRIATITRKNGLFDDVIHRIVEDGQGFFWMSSNKGVCRVLKRQLDAVAEGNLDRLDSVVYGLADGMRSTECNGGASSGWRRRDGTIWFPTTRGVVRIDPVRLPTNEVRPPVAIEEVRVDGREVEVQDPLRLLPGTQTLEVNYTALSLLAPAEVRFRYRLEGFDEDWVDPGARRTAYYTKLPHGKYRFHVIAANNDGLWNEDGAALALVVEPRWHETILFRGIGVLVFALVGPIFHRYRIRRLEHQKAALERLVADRTAEVEAANAELAQLAREDGLTGVANRRHLDAALDEEWRRAHRLATPLALILLDIDSFKAYNDQKGHQAGDLCLRAVAQATAQAHQRAGELVARYGGEEFAIILPGIRADAAFLAAENLRARIEDLALPHPASAVAPVVTVSLGSAGADPVTGGSPSDLVAAADRALYLAKQRGRNRAERAPEPVEPAARESFPAPSLK